MQATLCYPPFASSPVRHRCNSGDGYFPGCGAKNAAISLDEPPDLTRGVGCRWDDLDSSAVPFQHINVAARDMENPFVTEPWQAAVNRIY